MQEVQLSEWTAKMMRNQHYVMEAARRQQERINQKHLQATPSDLPITEYADNTLVLLRPPRGGKPDNKARLHNRGPMLVLGHNTPSSYQLRDLVDNTLHDVHITRLIPYFDSDPRSGLRPETVAARDRNLEFVDAILSHTGRKPYRTHKSTMKFQVLWSDQTVTTKYYNEIYNNEKLHEYLRANRMTALIPAAYKNHNAQNAHTGNRRHPHNL
jgi:hypothetical protein